MRVLVLAGGFDQIALIEELKLRGHYVILADYYENPMAKSAADKHYQASTLDVDLIEKVALEEKVDLITTACTDQALLTVAQVSEKLGLPCYLDYKTGLNVTNKEYMKQRFVDFSIPTAHHIIIDSSCSLDEKTSHLKYPLIVKPVDCNSSKGVIKISDKAALAPAVENAISLSRTKTAVVEEFIEGREYTVDFWIDNGKPRLLMASEITKLKNRDSFTINGCRTLPGLPQSKVSELERIAALIADAFELNNMPMFMQVIDDGENIYVLEFSARMGGGTKYRMIELYSSFPIMSVYVDRVLGKIPTVPKTLTKKSMLLSFIYCTKGIFKEIVGVSPLIEAGIVDEIYQYKSSGSYFDKAENSGDRVAGILLTGASDNEIDQKLTVALEKIQILDDTQTDIMLRL